MWTKYLQKYKRHENLMMCFFGYAMLSIEKIQKRNGVKAASSISPRKVTLKITMNYRGITLTTVDAKVYKSMLLNRIKPEIEKIPSKNLNGFQRNRFTTSQNLHIHRINDGVRTKIIEQILLFVVFTKAFYWIYRTKIKQVLQLYSIPKEA